MDCRRNILLGISFALVLLIAMQVWYEQSLCMGVRVVSPDFLEGYTECSDLDLTQLTFSGEKAAVDLERGQVYVSQSTTALSSYHKMAGKLAYPVSGYTLCFLQDEAMEDLAHTVREGRSLPLVIVGETVYQRVRVVISTLPVLRMDGNVTHQDEKERDVLSGGLTLWESSGGGVSAHSCDVQWHVRGGTTSWLDKKPWKLSLKDGAGRNLDHSFLGAGADDDWILNPMSMDDTKLREKLAMDLWNRMAEGNASAYPMSTGGYVETVVNGEYQGLYLLQRRVDEKYLQINRKQDILLKGKPIWTANMVQDGYEIIYSPYDDAQTYEILNQVSVEGNQFEITLQNFIDVSILINYGVMSDNTDYKNMFYLLKWEDAGYRISLIPWDTDMSFGIVWKEDFACDFDKALNATRHRMEYSLMQKQNPQIDQRIAERWQELRTRVYTEAAIGQLLTDSMAEVKDSGAFDRDAAKWGFYYGGEDTQERMYRFCMERLTWLDQYYCG